MTGWRGIRRFPVAPAIALMALNGGCGHDGEDRRCGAAADCGTGVWWRRGAGRDRRAAEPGGPGGAGEGRPGHHPHLRAAGAAVRGRAPGQFRGVRLAGAAVGLFVNDFDETLPGPFEWDVKRLAASLAVAGRDNGFPAKARRKIVLAGVEGYRTAMRAFAETYADQNERDHAALQTAVKDGRA
jgi:hypothetical protein